MQENQRNRVKKQFRNKKMCAERFRNFNDDFQPIDDVIENELNEIVVNPEDNGEIVKNEESENKNKEDKAMSFVDKILDWGNKGASIFEKIKGGGATMYDAGDKYEIYPEDKENEKADKMMRNWVIGILAFVLISVTVLIVSSKKKDK